MGRTTTFGYDRLFRVTSVDYSDAGTADVAYTYDRHGNRLTMADGTGSTRYSYDELDRPVSIVQPQPPGTTGGDKTVGYRYDLDGNRRALLYPDGTRVNYTHDKASRMASLAEQGTSRSVSYGYASDGLVTGATNFNATASTYAYDNARRLTGIRHTHSTASGPQTISEHGYTLDRLGNRTHYQECQPTFGSGTGVACVPQGFGGDSTSSATTMGATGDAASGAPPELADAYLYAAPAGLLDFGMGIHVAQAAPALTPGPSPMRGGESAASATGTATPVATAATAATATPTAAAPDPTPAAGDGGQTSSGTSTAGTTVASATPSVVVSATATSAAAVTGTATPTPAPTGAATATATATATGSATRTPTATATGPATATATRTGTATAAATLAMPAARTATGLAPKAVVATDPASRAAYGAAGSGYAVELLERDAAAPAGVRASVRFEHPATGASLRFTLPGTVVERRAAGNEVTARVAGAFGTTDGGSASGGTAAGASPATATATGTAASGPRASAPSTAAVGAPVTGTTEIASASPASAPATELVARWTSFEDRLKEDLVLASRPATSTIVFEVEAQRVVLAADGKGGYWAHDAYGQARFHVLPPTVEDATGKAGAATLTITGSQAALAVDPVFLQSAAYPVTIDPTVTWTTYNAPTDLTYDAYAPLSQLKAVGDNGNPNGGKSDYQYDLARNRTRRVQGPVGSVVTTTYTYDKADRLDRTADHLGATLVDYTFDNAGNMTARAGGAVNDAFSYDQANRLTQAVVSGGTSTTSAYAYNGDGVRVSKQVTGLTNATTRYVWDLAGGLPTLLEDGTRKYVWGATAAGLGQAYNVSVSSGAVEVYHQDHLRSIRELTGADGHVTSIYLTDEYGVPSTLEGPDGTPATASDQPFWFTGELLDGGPKRPGEPNLLYLRARYYDPGTGRFVSRDPVQSSNRFTYAENNPTNATDRSGLQVTGPAPLPCQWGGWWCPAPEPQPGPAPSPTPAAPKGSGQSETLMCPEWGRDAFSTLLTIFSTEEIGEVQGPENDPNFGCRVKATFYYHTPVTEAKSYINYTKDHINFVNGMFYSQWIGAIGTDSRTAASIIGARMASFTALATDITLYEISDWFAINLAPRLETLKRRMQSSTQLS